MIRLLQYSILFIHLFTCASLDHVHFAVVGTRSYALDMYVTLVFSTCRSIGKHLAYIDDVHLVTAGFAGVQDTIAKAYKEGCSHRHRMANIWHAVSKTRQKVTSL